MDLTAYYPVFAVFGVILLFIIVIAAAFILGKRKYNADRSIVKEKKVKEKKVREKKNKSAVKISEKDAAAAAAFNKSREADDDEEYEKAVSTLKEESAKNKKQEIIEEPVIIVDEKKTIPEEEVIEWKPPVEEKKTAFEPEVPIAAAPEKPAGDEWNDEDLELFEARTYAFDEETQSGYMKDETAEPPEPVKTPEEPAFVYRERREQNYDPTDDEGVQIIETEKKDEPAPAPAEEPKKSNSKYAYFDSVMEKEKAQSNTEWQPPEKKSEPTPTEQKSENKPKKTMQYIELDLDEEN